MPVCFFDDNYQEKYTCNYEFQDRGIEIDVDYDVSEEVKPDKNGVKIIDGNTKYKNRDILIIDHHSRRNILVKHAHFAGNTIAWGSSDGGAQTKFHASIYFEHEDGEKISQLPTIPKIKKLRIFSKSLLDWIGYQSLEFTKTQDYINYKILITRQGTSIPINHNGIKQITVGDDWQSSRSRERHNITIDFSGYIRTYVQRQFGMFKGEEKPVRIRFLFTLLDTMVERFGTNARYKKIDDTFYSLETNVEISDQFYGWVSGFGRRVSLLGEKDVVDGYRAYLDKLRGMYPDKDGQ